MSAADHLGKYAEGWGKGDADIIVTAIADGYTLDDPNEGIISKQGFSNYFAALKQTVASLCGDKVPDPFLELSEVMTQEQDGVLSAWCWWTFPGSGISGSGLIKVNENGVISEVLTYHTKLGG